MSHFTGAPERRFSISTASLLLALAVLVSFHTEALAGDPPPGGQLWSAVSTMDTLAVARSCAAEPGCTSYAAPDGLVVDAGTGQPLLSVHAKGAMDVGPLLDWAAGVPGVTIDDKLVHVFDMTGHEVDLSMDLLDAESWAGLRSALELIAQDAFVSVHGVPELAPGAHPDLAAAHGAILACAGDPDCLAGLRQTWPWLDAELGIGALHIDVPHDGEPGRHDGIAAELQGLTWEEPPWIFAIEHATGGHRTRAVGRMPSGQLDALQAWLDGRSWSAWSRPLTEDELSMVRLRLSVAEAAADLVACSGVEDCHWGVGQEHQAVTSPAGRIGVVFFGEDPDVEGLNGLEYPGWTQAPPGYVMDGAAGLLAWEPLRDVALGRWDLGEALSLEVDANPELVGLGQQDWLDEFGEDDTPINQYAPPPDADRDCFLDEDDHPNAALLLLHAGHCDGGVWADGIDCDDTDENVYPGAPALCDGKDNDCDPATVEFFPPDAWDVDGDGDGFLECADDCDDDNATVFPGAPELCDGLDNDCDGAPPIDETTDLDGDGFPVCADCHDGDASIHPAAAELCNGWDDDCDGLLLSLEVDLDGDGYLGCIDCVDLDPLVAPLAPSIHPGATEVCDGYDTDCDPATTAEPGGEADLDSDGWIPCAGDCDDGNADSWPGAPEICDGLDNDCNGVLGDSAPEDWEFHADQINISTLDRFYGNRLEVDAATRITSIEMVLPHPGSGPRQLTWHVYERVGATDTYHVIFSKTSEYLAGLPDWHSSGDIQVDLPGAGEYLVGVSRPSTTSPSARAGFAADVVDPFSGRFQFLGGVEAAAPLGATTDFAYVSGGFHESIGYYDDAAAWFMRLATEALPGDETDGDGDGLPACADCDDGDDTLNNLDQDNDGYSSCGGDCDDGDAATAPLEPEFCDGMDTDCDTLLDVRSDADLTPVEVWPPSGYRLSLDPEEMRGVRLDATADGGIESFGLFFDRDAPTIDLPELHWVVYERVEGTWTRIFHQVTGLPDGLPEDTETWAGPVGSIGVPIREGHSYLIGALNTGITNLTVAEKLGDPAPTELGSVVGAFSTWTPFGVPPEIIPPCVDPTDQPAFGLVTYLADNELDEDSDGWWACEDCDDDQVGNADSDGDGFRWCDDCDDQEASVHPGAAEVCDGVDSDCNGVLDFPGTLTPEWTTVAGWESTLGDSPGMLVGNQYLVTQDCVLTGVEQQLVRPGNGVADLLVFRRSLPTDPWTLALAADVVRPTGWPVESMSLWSTTIELGLGLQAGEQVQIGVWIDPAEAELSWAIDEPDPFFFDSDLGFATVSNGIAVPLGPIVLSSHTWTPWPADPPEWRAVQRLEILVADQEEDVDTDGHLVCGGDCDDLDDTVHPDAAEELCDGKDTDCNIATNLPGDEDADMDGYLACAGCVDGLCGDCDDGLAVVHPGASEGCDDIDTDCDGVLGDAEIDLDGDDWTECDGDCEPDIIEVGPHAEEICDGIDNNCDGDVDEDFDADGDFWTSCDGDCDDGNPAVHPGADEGCDGLDTDCFGGPAADEADEDDDGYMICQGDCADDPVLDPLAAQRNPDAPEVCNFLDDNCDDFVDEVGAQGEEDLWPDIDGDGYGAPGTPWLACLQDGWVNNDEDCDDGNASINPLVAEACNGFDDNCDNTLYEGGEGDSDGDGALVCDGHEDDDCDDSDPSVFPGAAEGCNGLDNDCDGVLPAHEADEDQDYYMVCQGDCSDDPATDPNAGQRNPGLDETCTTDFDDDCDGATNDETAIDALTWYEDADMDLYGDLSVSKLACEQPDGFVEDPTDCDVVNGFVNPGMDELCDGLDTDCDTTTTHPLGEEDSDGDGFRLCDGDCDDSNAVRFPGNPEVCDGYDNDCEGDPNGADEYQDLDNDGWAVCDGDCSDDPNLDPDADEHNPDHPPEQWGDCDGIDNDCDGTVDFLFDFTGGSWVASNCAGDCPTLVPSWSYDRYDVVEEPTVSLASPTLALGRAPVAYLLEPQPDGDCYGPGGGGLRSATALMFDPIWPTTPGELCVQWDYAFEPVGETCSPFTAEWGDGYTLALFDSTAPVEQDINAAGEYGEGLGAGCLDNSTTERCPGDGVVVEFDAYNNNERECTTPTWCPPWDEACSQGGPYCPPTPSIGLSTVGPSNTSNPLDPLQELLPWEQANPLLFGECGLWHTARVQISPDIPSPTDHLVQLDLWTAADTQLPLPVADPVTLQPGLRLGFTAGQCSSHMHVYLDDIAVRCGPCE